MRPTTRSLPFLAVIFITCSSTTFRQQKKKSEKKKVYYAYVEVTTERRKDIIGVLQEVSDSAILLFTKGGSRMSIEANTIEHIAIKRKGHVGRGLIIGSVIGVGVGAIIGFASGDTECDGSPFCASITAGEKAAVDAVAIGGLGALIGWGIGSRAKKSLKVGGNQFVFSKNVELLR